MSQSNLIFEATRQASGNFVCDSAPEVQEPKTSNQQHHETDYRQEKFVNDDAANGDGSSTGRQAYYIDPQLLFGVSPPWVKPNNSLFQHTFESNLNGGYNGYYQQMLQQYEQMRAILNSQLSHGFNRE